MMCTGTFWFIVDFESQVEHFAAVEALSPARVLRQLLPRFPRVGLEVDSEPRVVAVVNKVENNLLRQEVFLLVSEVV